MQPSVILTLQPLSDNMSDHKNDAGSSGKRKRGPSSPPNTNTPSSTYANAFKTGAMLFQDVADAHPQPQPPRPARHSISKKSAHLRTIPLRERSSSTSTRRKGPRKPAPVTTASAWKLDKETGTFVAVVSAHEAVVNRPPRSAISNPHYHRPISSADSHDHQSHTSLFSSTVGDDSDARYQTSSPAAVEHPFPVQYPTYAVNGRSL